jgi:hypothetical protein
MGSITVKKKQACQRDGLSSEIDIFKISTFINQNGISPEGLIDTNLYGWVVAGNTNYPGVQDMFQAQEQQNEQDSAHG